MSFDVGDPTALLAQIDRLAREVAPAITPELRRAWASQDRVMRLRMARLAQKGRHDLVRAALASKISVYAANLECATPPAEGEDRWDPAVAEARRVLLGAMELLDHLLAVALETETQGEATPADERVGIRRPPLVGSIAAHAPPTRAVLARLETRAAA